MPFPAQAHTPSISEASICIGEARVAETALRKGCLDYRALLRTNFLHGAGSVNLFDLVIEELLANYPLVSVGPTRLQDEGKFAAYQSIINQIETFRQIVLNPLSHTTPTTVTRAEIQGAIDAVDVLNL